MNDRRKALVARFRAGAADRLRHVTLALLGLAEGDGGAAREIARELHTLKGESSMLGFAAAGQVLHAAETLLGPAGRPGPEATLLLEDALAEVGRALQQTLPGDDATLGALRDRLLAAARDAAPATRRPASPGGPASGRPAAGEVPVTLAAPAPSGGPAPTAAPASARPETPRAEAPSPIPADPARPPSGRAAERWVQIDARRVDDLCERITGFAGNFQALSRRLDALLRPGSGELAGEGLRRLSEELDRCRAGLDDITDASWTLRLAPVEPVLVELVEHARELASRQGKRLRVSVEAGEAAVERSLLDELWEPLVHLVRNAVDHGIEASAERPDKRPEGLLELRAEAIGPSVILSVTDDGRGIDPARVRAAATRRGLLGAGAAPTDAELFDLLFSHGFSTRETVNDVSGRGVGLDVVRNKVEALGGTVAVSSAPGQGTRFLLTVPATLSKERALVIRCGELLYGVPSRSVVELVRVADHAIEAVAGGRAIWYRDVTIPLRSLGATLGGAPEVAEPWAAVLEAGGRRWAFAIPDVVGVFDLVRRPLDPILAPRGYLGASSTLDDGSLVLLLLTAGLIRRAESRGPAPTPPPAPSRRRPRVLVVDDAPMVRDLLSDVLTEAGIEVQAAPGAEAALGLLDGALPDLVLSDVDMPGMNGFELVRRIRQRSARLPVILLSARSSDEDRRRADEAGASAYLVKSAFQPSALLDAVGRWLGPPG